MSVTLKDIADYLNISVSTVSRVVTGKDRVNPETRKRILEAIEKFDYHPNDVARSLKKKSTKAFGVIVPDITDNFFALVFKGFESVVRQQKYTVILCNSNEDEETENEYLKFLMEKQIAGLVIATVSNDNNYFEKYKDLGIPMVFIDNSPNLKVNYDYISIDNVQASYELINHLIEVGHKKVGIISGPLNRSSGLGTFKGWEMSLKEHNIEIQKNWIKYGTFKRDSGYELMKEILEQSERPSAVFAANKEMAYGALKACEENGITIPDDMAIVTFGTYDETGLFLPQITSIIEPAKEIGIVAGEIILQRVANPKIKSYQKVILEHQLSIKESSKFIEKF